MNIIPETVKNYMDNKDLKKQSKLENIARKSAFEEFNIIRIDGVDYITHNGHIVSMPDDAKGLGSLNNQQYKEMMQHPTFHFFTKDDLSEQTLNRWFGKGIAKTRRDVLKTEVQNTETEDIS